MSAITATLPGAPHGPWLCSGMWSGTCREPSFAVGVFLTLSMSCHAVPYHVKLCHAMLCHVVPCHTTPCRARCHCKQAEGHHRPSGRRGQTLLLQERPQPVHGHWLCGAAEEQLSSGDD